MSLVALPADLHWLLGRDYLRQHECLLLRLTCRRLRDCIQAPPWSLRACTSLAAGAEAGAPLNVMLLYAVEHNSPALLRWLQREPLVQWTSQADSGELLCACAAAHGALRAIKYLLAHGYAWSARAEDAAAQYGHAEILRWRLRTASGDGLWRSTCVAQVAARHRQYAVLRLAVQHQGIESLRADDWAHVRDRDTIDFLHANYVARRAQTIPRDSIDRDRHQMLMRIAAVGLCCAAAASGHLVLLDALLAQLRDANTSLRYDDRSRVCAAAASAGQLDTLVHLKRRHALQERDETLEAAAHAGHVHVMRWVCEQRVPCRMHICCLAIAALQFDAAVYAMRAYCHTRQSPVANVVLSPLWRLAADARCSDAVLEEVLERVPPLHGMYAMVLIMQAPLQRLEQLYRRYPRAPWCFAMCAQHLREQRTSLLVPHYAHYKHVPEVQRRAQRAAMDARLACLARLAQDK